MHNVELRVLCPPQRRVVTAPDPILLALVDMHRTSPCIARNAVACEVVEPKIARL